MDITGRVISAFLWLILVSRVLPRVAGNAEGGVFLFLFPFFFLGICFGRLALFLFFFSSLVVVLLAQSVSILTNFRQYTLILTGVSS